MLRGRNRDEMCFVSAEKLMLYETTHLLRHIRCGSLRNATVTQYHYEAGHAERVPPDRGRKPESTRTRTSLPVKVALRVFRELYLALTSSSI